MCNSVIQEPVMNSYNEGQKNKKAYVAPLLEVFEYEVEQGFAQSNVRIDHVYNTEEITEITDKTGQNYHGEWF